MSDDSSESSSDAPTVPGGMHSFLPFPFANGPAENLFRLLGSVSFSIYFIFFPPDFHLQLIRMLLSVVIICHLWRLVRTASELAF